MNNELAKALKIMEEERAISRDVLLDAIENSLLQAYKNHYGRSDNCKVWLDRDTCEFKVYAVKEVVDEVYDDVLEISLDEAKEIDPTAEIGDTVEVEQNSTAFGRIATQNAKNVILQKIREEERRVLFDKYFQQEKTMVTGEVHRFLGNNLSINLGKVDAILPEKEQIPGEKLDIGDRVKLYVVEVRDTNKGPKITVSRTRPELVLKLFELEVTEVANGTVVIESVAREAGSRTKISVRSNNPEVDPVGACIGLNQLRVKAVVNDINGEKIDIVNWSENPADYIENALSPAKVISVMADVESKEARVVVPDKQLSLAIGKEGQNARLAAKLTGYKIDIKSETQAIEDWHIYDEVYAEHFDEDEELSEEDLEDAVLEDILDEEEILENEVPEETLTEEEISEDEIPEDAE